MFIRPDMVGPRPLRPAAGAPVPNYVDHTVYPSTPILPVTIRGAQNGVMPGCRPAVPPPPAQPALVLVEPQMEKSLRSHVDYLHKAGAAIAVSEPEGPHGPDVSTPQHDHARLQAKRIYLTERLAGHQNAGHSPNHPDVQQRQQALESVETKLKNYEAAGIRSTPDHHDDWLHHYSKNPQGHSEAHVSAGISAHIGHLGGERAQAERKKMAGPSGSMGLEVHPDAPHSTHDAFKKPSSIDAMISQARSSTPSMGSSPQKETVSLKKPVSRPEGTGVTVRSPGVSKSKSDDWIGEKIRILMHEGKPQKQAIAIAYSMAGRAKKSQPPLMLSV